MNLKIPIISVIIVAISTLSYFAFVENLINRSHPSSPPPYNGRDRELVPIDMSNWLTYRNNQFGFEFKYPKNLTLSKEEDKIILNHSIPYENSGDCDMLGGNHFFKTLEDFNTSIQLVNKKPPLINADNFYSAGTLNCSEYYEGSEGCGYISYHCPIEINQTLIIQRAAVQALSGISTVWDIENILKIPGAISKDESEKIFHNILSTFKIIQ